jgi:hypothetical protein
VVEYGVLLFEVLLFGVLLFGAKYIYITKKIIATNFFFQLEIAAAPASLLAKYRYIPPF